MGGGEWKLQFKCWDSAHPESRTAYGNGWFTLLAVSLSCTVSLEWARGSGGRGRRQDVHKQFEKLSGDT